MTDTEASSLASRLEAVFDERFVERALDTLELRERPTDIVVAARADATQRVADLRNLVAELAHPDDVQELYRSLAFFWLELRFAWTRHNQVIQYQSVFRGAAEPVVVARASMCAQLLAQVEELLDPRDLETLVNLAGEPLAIGGPDVPRIWRFVEHHQSQVEQLEQAGATALIAGGAVGEFASLPVDLVWPMVTEVVRTQVSDRIVAELDDPEGLTIDVRHVPLMCQLGGTVSTWIRDELARTGDPPEWGDAETFHFAVTRTARSLGVSARAPTRCPASVEQHQQLAAAVAELLGDNLLVGSVEAETGEAATVGVRLEFSQAEQEHAA